MTRKNDEKRPRKRGVKTNDRDGGATVQTHESDVTATTDGPKKVIAKAAEAEVDKTSGVPGLALARAVKYALLVTPTKGTEAVIYFSRDVTGGTPIVAGHSKTAYHEGRVYGRAQEVPWSINGAVDIAEAKRLVATLAGLGDSHVHLSESGKLTAYHGFNLTDRTTVRLHPRDITHIWRPPELGTILSSTPASAADLLATDRLCFTSEAMTKAFSLGDTATTIEDRRVCWKVEGKTRSIGVRIVDHSLLGLLVGRAIIASESCELYPLPWQQLPLPWATR